tara:strand:+ start:345 stop:575 length:231 start_codon:yes stop_codon:yes gene_type:complete
MIVLEDWRWNLVNRIQNIDKINIFNNPEFMRTWGKQFVKACGSTTMKVKPDMLRLRFLMDKFVKDYNEQLGVLEEE